MIDDPEIGRELRADELKDKTVVVLARDDRPHAITAWVGLIGSDYVAFQMNACGGTPVTFITYLAEDGLLRDDSGATIHILEYLGEI